MSQVRIRPESPVDVDAIGEVHISLRIQDVSWKRDDLTNADDAIARFEQSTRAFLDVLHGVPEPAWLRRPTGEPSSLADTVEHVVLADRSVRARLQQLPGAPLLAGAAPRFDDAEITAGMFDAAGPAPPGLAEPTGRFATPAEGIAALVAACEHLVAWVRETPVDLRSHALPHPVFGLFDGVQWILFAAAHTDNHLPQLRALCAPPGPVDTTRKSV